MVQAKYASEISGLSPSPTDSLDKITMTGYHPEKMEYVYSASQDRFAVFSEIFYSPEKGWKTYLNGQPYQDFIKTNYLVRGLKLPKGESVKLEMRFEPKSWHQGESISLIASILAILLCLGGAFMYFKRERFNTLESISDVESEMITQNSSESRTTSAPKPVVKQTKPGKK